MPKRGRHQTKNCSKRGQEQPVIVLSRLHLIQNFGSSDGRNYRYLVASMTAMGRSAREQRQQWLSQG